LQKAKTLVSVAGGLDRSFPERTPRKARNDEGTHAAGGAFIQGGKKTNSEKGSTQKENAPERGYMRGKESNDNGVIIPPHKKRT